MSGVHQSRDQFRGPAHGLPVPSGTEPVTIDLKDCGNHLAGLRHRTEVDSMDIAQSLTAGIEGAIAGIMVTIDSALSLFRGRLAHLRLEDTAEDSLLLGPCHEAQRRHHGLGTTSADITIGLARDPGITHLTGLMGV